MKSSNLKDRVKITTTAKNNNNRPNNQKRNNFARAAYFFSNQLNNNFARAAHFFSNQLKTTLHVQQTFFVHFFAVPLHDSNVKLLLISYLHIIWWKCLSSCSLCFFTAAQFHISRRQRFSFINRRYIILMFFFQRNWSPLLFISRSSSFHVI